MFFWLSLLSIILFAVGIVNPKLVIRWGEKRNRKKVFLIYGLGTIVCFCLFGMSVPDTTSVPVKNEVAVKKEVKEETKPSVQKTITKEQAENKINDWLWEHEFPGVNKMELISGEDFKVGDKCYYLFTLTGLHRAVDILVDKNNANLYYYDIGMEPYDLTSWYLDYIEEHKSQSNTKINDKFEWVELPHFQNGCIVGKVKNISQKEFKEVFIEFNILDSNNNNLGTVAGQLRNMKPGNVWSFKILNYYQGGSTFNFENITGYTW